MMRRVQFLTAGEYESSGGSQLSTSEPSPFSRKFSLRVANLWSSRLVGSGVAGDSAEIKQTLTMEKGYRWVATLPTDEVIVTFSQDHGTAISAE